MHIHHTSGNFRRFRSDYFFQFCGHYVCVRTQFIIAHYTNLQSLWNKYTSTCIQTHTLTSKLRFLKTNWELFRDGCIFSRKFLKIRTTEMQTGFVYELHCIASHIIRNLNKLKLQAWMFVFFAERMRKCVCMRWECWFAVRMTTAEHVFYCTLKHAKYYKHRIIQFQSECFFHCLLSSSTLHIFIYMH